MIKTEPHIMLSLLPLWDKPKPYILFESELHFRNQHRRIYTAEAYDSLTFSVEEEYKTFTEEVGYDLILGLTVRSDDNTVQMPYLFHRNGRPVLRIDEEPYQYKRKRQFCLEMPFPSADWSELCADKPFQKKIGHTVAKMLGLEFGKEPKMVLEK